MSNKGRLVEGSDSASWENNNIIIASFRLEVEDTFGKKLGIVLSTSKSGRIPKHGFSQDKTCNTPMLLAKVIATKNKVFKEL